MPGFNGTGPQGMGPRTGGGRGFCTPGARTAYGVGAGMNRGVGRGGGRARGGGRGRSGPGFAGAGYGAYAPYAEASPQQEKEFLKNQAVLLEQELTQTRKRLDALSAQANPAE